MPSDTDLSLQKLLKEQPFEYYLALQQRFKEQNNALLTPMPELKNEIDNLIQALHHPFIDDLIAYQKTKNDFMSQQSHLELRRNACEIELRSVLLKQVLDNHPDMIHCPRSLIASDRLPYLPTIQAISKTLDFFDEIECLTKENISPKYYDGRYTHYEQQSPIDLESGITIPFSGLLTLTDLIRLRAVPLWISGVSPKATFADGFFNSPKEFFLHDVNHNRRFKGYNDLYFRLHQIQDTSDKIKTYQQFDFIIQHQIIPTFKINKTDSPEEKSLKLTLKAFYFEFLHEYAFPPDRDFLIEALKFRCGDPAPFEVFLNEENTEKSSVRQDIEKMRATRSLTSTFDLNKPYNPKQKTNVFIYHDNKGPNFLTSLWNKLSSDFFDNEFYRIKDIPKKEQRRSELVVQSAKKAMNLFNITAEDIGLTDDNIDEKLLNLATNKRDNGQAFGPLDNFSYPLKKTSLKKEVVNRVILPAVTKPYLCKKSYKFFTPNKTNDDLSTIKSNVNTINF